MRIYNTCLLTEKFILSVFILIIDTFLFIFTIFYYLHYSISLKNAVLFPIFHSYNLKFFLASNTKTTVYTQVLIQHRVRRQLFLPTVRELQDGSMWEGDEI